jgi:hypothetical protein
VLGRLADEFGIALAYGVVALLLVGVFVIFLVGAQYLPSSSRQGLLNQDFHYSHKLIKMYL